MWWKKDFTFHFSYYEGNLINSNGTFVPDNYEFPVFDDDLNVFLLNPNSIASFKILNSIILSIIRSIVKHICGTSNDCLYMTSIPKNTMLIILNKMQMSRASFPLLFSIQIWIWSLENRTFELNGRRRRLSSLRAIFRDHVVIFFHFFLF